MDGSGKAAEIDLRLHGEFVRFSSALNTKDVPRVAREPTPRLSAPLAGPEVSSEKFQAAPVKSNIASKPRTERREPRTERELSEKSAYNSDLQRRVEVILSRNGQVSPHLSQRPVVLSRATSCDKTSSWAPNKEVLNQRITKGQLKLDASPRSLASPDRDTPHDVASSIPLRPPSRMHTRQREQSPPKNLGEGCEAHHSGHQKISSPAAMNLEALRASADALGRIAKGISRSNSGEDREERSGWAVSQRESPDPSPRARAASQAMDTGTSRLPRPNTRNFIDARGGVGARRARRSLSPATVGSFERARRERRKKALGRMGLALS